MTKKLRLVIAVFAGICVLTACSDTGDTTQNSGTASPDTSMSETESENSDIGDAVSDTIGVWVYNQELIYHASNNTRYSLKEDTNGTIKDTTGKTYSIQECDYKLYYITKSKDTLTIKEGRYNEKYLNSKECPDGYKPMVITYKKCDLFDLNALEKSITGNEIKTTEQSQEETTTQSKAESESETMTEHETTTTEAISESESVMSDIEENAEYTKIYQDLEDFLETDNFKQKDNGNRALELFNHLHNASDANIEQDSIINDTAKNEVRFHCYEKYTITINVEDSIITVTED